MLRTKHKISYSWDNFHFTASAHFASKPLYYQTVGRLTFCLRKEWVSSWKQMLLLKSKIHAYVRSVDHTFQLCSYCHCHYDYQQNGAGNRVTWLGGISFTFPSIIIYKCSRSSWGLKPCQEFYWNIGTRCKIIKYEPKHSTDKIAIYKRVFTERIF